MIWERAIQQPIEHNFNSAKDPRSAGMKKPIGLIVHWTATANSAIDARNWFNIPGDKRPNIKSGSSAHFVIDRDGSVIQCIDTDCRAFSVDGNTIDGQRVSVEIVAGPSIGDFTPEQIQTCGDLLKWLNQWFGVPFKLAKDKLDSGVSYHRMYSSTTCPGENNIKILNQIVEAAQYEYIDLDKP